MTTEEILERLRGLMPEALLADGFEDAIIGIVEGACRPTVVAYDYQKCVRILVKRDGMDEEEADEFLQFNTVGAYVGEMTPLFVHDWRKSK